MKKAKGKFSGRFSCVYCGKRVKYNKRKNKLICTNPDCSEKSPVSWNPLAGCVWAGIIPIKADPATTKDSAWNSVSKEYILAHKDEFHISPEKKTEVSK